MAIELVPGITGRKRPGVVCDHCGEVIRTGYEGNVHWAASANAAPILRFVHARCSLAFEARWNQERWSLEPMSRLLGRLGSVQHRESMWDRVRRVLPVLRRGTRVR